MQLELDSGKHFREATEADILALIAGEQFAILSQNPGTYLQCAERDPPNDYVLEYQDGSTDFHYSATDAPISLERVQATFLKYLRGDISWLNDFRWEKITF